jgi:glycosyltransferase involved in cell wall biosynthesis
VLDVHGDWRTATRLYGSPLRRLLAPLGDRAAAWAVRRADAVRPVGPFTANLVRAAGVEPAGVFPAFIDVDEFTRRPPEPLPDRPQALFVGVAELYKNIDGIAQAWRLAAPRVPNARLRVVSTGSRRDVFERLAIELPEQTTWTPRLPPEDIARALDESSFLLLASRSEGLPRIVVEALARGRPVLGARSGGIPDVVRDGHNGVLVDPNDPKTLADELVRLLSDRPLVERLAAQARPSVEPFLATPEDYARRIRALVESSNSVLRAS